MKPDNDELIYQRQLFLGEYWNSGDFLDWFGRYGLALIEEVLHARGVPEEAWSKGD